MNKAKVYPTFIEQGMFPHCGNAPRVITRRRHISAALRLAERKKEGLKE